MTDFTKPHEQRGWIDENDVGNTCCMKPANDPIHIAKRWPSGAHVLVRGHRNVGSTGHVGYDANWLDNGDGKANWVYIVHFDDWRLGQLSYWQHELERINVGSNMGLH